ncbi:hypothetical protein BC332_34566 [Capsicum chinense]|nr:hypothetical protein BC332_34566 [Capsicum chinense]
MRMNLKKNLWERRVGFDFDGVPLSTVEDCKPNRLHRRDTPHHLKNKRVNRASDSDSDRNKVAAILSNVSIQELILL